MRYSEESCLILARAWRPRSKSIRGEGTARSTRTRIVTPEQARPIAPHRAHLAYSTALKLPLGPRNKKSAQTATFLRLAIVPNSPIVNRGIKTQAIGRAAAYYHPAATKKEPLIAKKLQKCRDFCFCDGRSRRNGPNRRNGLNATGQTYRSNSTETGQWSDPMISELMLAICTFSRSASLTRK